MALTVGTGAGFMPVQADQKDAGPPYRYTTEIVSGTVVPLKDAAMITKSRHGYVFHAGQQDTRLRVTTVRGGLRFVDRGTKRWSKLTRGCRKQSARRGVAAVCRLPGAASSRRPLLLEVWPRLGDDHVDGSRLPARVAMAVLGDAGNDVARLGSGADFFNGAMGRDRVTGGAGNDWLRTGEGADRIRGGAGHDRLMGVKGRDHIGGGSGNDRVGGDAGSDRLSGGAGRDRVICGAGRDRARIDRIDSVTRCEAVARR